MKKKIVVPIVIGILVLSLTACSSVGSTGIYPEIRTISVSAEHSIVVVPDMVEVSGGMDITLPTANEAQSKMAEVTNQITAAMSNIGIANEDIKISSISINEAFDYTDAGRVSLGYRAQSQFVIKPKIENAGAIISEMTNSGATYISSTNHVVSNKEAKYEEALAIAVTKAKEKATKMLAGLNKEVSGVVNISESSQTNYYPYQTRMSASNETSEMDSVNVMAGTENIIAKVDIVFEIK